MNLRRYYHTGLTDDSPVVISLINAWFSWLDNTDHLMGYDFEGHDVPLLDADAPPIPIKKHRRTRFSVSAMEAQVTDDDVHQACILRHINLHVGRGEYVVVTGRVGCGKSSLITAILGEMTRVHGEVMIAPAILAKGFGYAAQEPWIQVCMVYYTIDCQYS